MKHEARSMKQEARSKKQEAGSKKHEARSMKHEPRNKKQETQEARSKKHEARSMKKQPTTNNQQPRRKNQEAESKMPATIHKLQGPAARGNSKSLIKTQITIHKPEPQLQLAQLALGKGACPGEFIPSAAQGMVNHQQPYGEGAQRDEGADKSADQRKEAAEDMDDHKRAKSDQRLQGMEQHEAAALLQGKKYDAAYKGEEIAYGGGNMLRKSGG
jgi:hypothetical protein